MNFNIQPIRGGPSASDFVGKQDSFPCTKNRSDAFQVMRILMDECNSGLAIIICHPNMNLW